MDKFNKNYVFKSVSLIREAHDSSNDNYTQHTPNPRFDLIRLDVALEFKKAFEDTSRLKKELIEMHKNIDLSRQETINGLVQIIRTCKKIIIDNQNYSEEFIKKLNTFI